MDWLEIIKFALVVLSFVIGTAIPFIIALSKALKARKAAQTEAEKEKANAELYNLAKQLIQGAEVAYEEFNTYMKSKGLTAGSLKKKDVMIELKSFALENGYAFDPEIWGEKIDEIVTLTRNVNAKK